MSKAGKRRRAGLPAEELPAAGRVAGPRPRSRSRWGFRLLALLLVPLGGLAALELGLRLGGFGNPTGFFVRHPMAGPERVVDNARFSWRFFPPALARHPEPVILATPKPAGTFRIFVFGESAAMGDPMPAFGFSRILEILLEARHPSVRFEVLNTAITAINSHVIREIARDARRFEADLWLVYMGHNEVVGPFGTGTILGGQALPLPLIRATLALKATRTGQLLDQLRQRVVRNDAALTGWRGMGMWTRQQVRADDPRLARLYAHFRRNLDDIIRLGVSSGARVVVSTTVSNLKDCAPFGSLHSPGLAGARLADWERAARAGEQAAADKDFARAAEHFREALALDPAFAETHFRLARCLLALNRVAEAKPHFEQARNLDTRRFRADSRLNEIVRATVADVGPAPVRLLDAETAFAERSRSGTPGEEWFYEHVHFNFSGNYLLARLFAEAVERELPAAMAGTGAPQDWLEEGECARRLAFTEDQAHTAAEMIRQRNAEPPFTLQFDHDEVQRRLDARAAELRRHIKPTGLHRAVETCRRAVQLRPDDWVLHDLLARLLASLGEHEAARTEWRRVTELVPHFARTWCELARVAQRQSQADAAIAQFQRALEVNPDWADAHAGLGLLLADQGRTAEAVRHLRAALRADPTRAEAAVRLSQLLGAASESR